MSVRPRDRRGADLGFAIGFGIYVLGSFIVLGQGLVAVFASFSPGLHEFLHVEGLGTGVWARVAIRAADASHAVPSVPQIAADYGFSVVHLVLAAILIRLRPRDGRLGS